MLLSGQVYKTMKDTYIERNEKYELSLWKEWPSLVNFNERVYLGNYSWTFTASKQRALSKNHVVNIGFGNQAPTEVARDYLKAKYPERLRATKAQVDSITQKRSAPLYCEPCELDHAVYIDVKSAYWSIVLAVGWDVDYFPGRWIGRKSDNRDFPLQHHKVARNSLVSAGLSTPVRVWDGRRVIHEFAQSRLINYGLWACVQDVMNGIAHEAINAGAVYVHTDGYIVPMSRYEAVRQVILSWGLNYSIKAEGKTTVRQVGNYTVGKKSTKNSLLSSHLYAIDHIEPHNLKWIKPRFRSMALRMKDYLPGAGLTGVKLIK